MSTTVHVYNNNSASFSTTYLGGLIDKRCDSPSPGRNRNRLSLGKVAGEQTLVSTGISFASSGDDRPEIPFEDDLSCETAVRFGDLSVMAVASAKRKSASSSYTYIRIYVYITYIHIYICTTHTSPLFELTECVQSPDVDGGASLSALIVCVYMCICVCICVFVSLLQYADCKTLHRLAAPAFFHHSTMTISRLHSNISITHESTDTPNLRVSCINFCHRVLSPAPLSVCKFIGLIVRPRYRIESRKDSCKDAGASWMAVQPCFAR